MSSGYVATTATRPTPRVVAAATKANAVVDAGTPSASSRAAACFFAPSQPNTKLALVEDHMTELTSRLPRTLAPSSNREILPIS